MTIFEAFLDRQLGSPGAASVTISEDGHPIVRISSDGDPVDGFLEIRPDSLILDGIADEAVAPLLPFGSKLRRIHDFLDRFPAEARRGDDVALFALDPPMSKPIWSDEGLWATVRVITSTGGSITDVREQENLLITSAALDADDWPERLAAFDAKRARWDERPGDLYPDEACLEVPPEPKPAEDEGWETFAEGLNLDPEALEARVAPVADAAFDALAGVRARYEEIYGLKLPSGLAHLAALVAALGQLPENPADHYWQPEPGLDRGNAWLESALSMRTAGLSAWFAPGALARELLDASALHEEVPRGGEGPLDPRLDMRYRRDAPQLVPFLGGDSDGLHWGFWYDSPDHFPVIAHNYARDSAETWLDREAEVVPLLRRKIAEGIEEATQQLETGEDEEARGYPLRQWRALRVVEAHLDAIEARASTREWGAEPLCPWPRTPGYPVGSPPLALRPDAGTVPPYVLGLGASCHAPSVEQQRSWIDEARRELAAGRPAYAHALGLYLHWADGDELRDEAGQLLLHAYEALGFRAFAGILKVHLLHRDLRSVGIFKGG